MTKIKKPKKSKRQLDHVVMLPTTKKEFYNYTKKYFGIGLHIKELNIWIDSDRMHGNYEILENHEVYANRKKCVDGNKRLNACYDYECNLFKKIFGDTVCGGIARTNYAQFRCTSNAQLQRVKKLAEDVASKPF